MKRLLGWIGPPKKEEQQPYTQEEYYCESCQNTLTEETVYSILYGKFLCSQCKKRLDRNG